MCIFQEEGLSLPLLYSEDSMDMNLRKFRETVKDRGAWCAAVHVFTKSQHNLANEQQQWGGGHLSFSLFKEQTH